MALAGSGQRVQAMENLQKTVDGVTGGTVDDNINEQLPDEEAQLTRYLDNLSGAVKSMVVTRLMNLGPNVESMKTHFSNTVYAERFARYYNMQVRQMMEQILSASAAGQDRMSEAGDQASAALQSWGEAAEMVGQDRERSRSTALVKRLTTTSTNCSPPWSATALSTARRTSRW